jgi:biopolymer transport protein ExbD
MTLNRMRAKMRKMAEEQEDEEMENGELNLVPYLDIVTNVIMFLMMTTTFAAAMANINVSAPTTSGAPIDGDKPLQEKQDLNLTVSISDKGYIIAASGAVLTENDIPGRLPTIPKKGGSYDLVGLTAKMRAIKDQVGQDETKVIINANPEITYETVVAAMDAIRMDAAQKTLFPDVVLAAGVQ